MVRVEANKNYIQAVGLQTHYTNAPLITAYIRLETKGELVGNINRIK